MGPRDLCCNRLLAGSGAAKAQAAAGNEATLRGHVFVLPLKCSSAVRWLSELLAMSFGGNTQCFCTAVLMFADPLHLQEEGQAAFSLFLPSVSIIG